MATDWTSWLSTYHVDPKVRLTLPPAYFFKFPPADIPRTLPPPSDHPTLAHPFTIPIDVYNAALSPNVPIFAALTYVTVISILNSVNKSRKYKPWAFSKTRFFKALVITHNIILAVYSAWTFVGMANALKTSIYPPWEEFGLAGTVDSLCKMHGPRDLGSAAIFNQDTSAWSVANRFVHLGADGLTPETTDVGRIWNQGLAFYGWLFYLSKFYEVIDTLIIIAKGKQSSFLQTFHHAGAMLCMWAGMRYMSAPIWMFVFVNSFIHAIMYTFYLCSAIGVRVPVWFKRTLTTLQITQFVVGAAYAFVHLFVEYQNPISVPYIYHLGDVASAAVSTAVASASAIATDDWQALLRKLALRAAGREGLAENVYDHRGKPFGIDAVQAAKDWVSREETRYRDDFEWVHCLDTSGQAFAVMLNVVYLLPLTWLFANFFIQSYLRRVERRRSSTASQKAQLARESVNDAARKSSRRLSQALENPQDGVEDTGDEFAPFDGDKVRKQANKAASKVKKETSNATASSKETINKGIANIRKESRNVSSRTESAVEDTISNVKSTSDQIVSKIEEQAGPAVEDAKQGMASTFENLKAQADSLKTKAQNQFGEYVEEGFERTKTAISSLVGGRDEDNSEARVGQSSSAQESTKRQSNPSLEDSQASDNLSSSELRDVESSTEISSESSLGKSGDKDASEKAEDLSPKEQVQQQKSKPKTEAEASTGDAEEDDHPAEQSSKQDISREATSPRKKSNKKKHRKQNSSVQDSQREDVANQEVDRQESDTKTTLTKAANSAEKATTNVVKKVEEAIENPSPVVNEAIGKVQNTARQAQNVISESTQSVKTTSASHERSKSHDYDDQKESWIEVRRTPEKKGGKGSTKGTESNRPASPEWFEKLTSGIDSPSKLRESAGSTNASRSLNKQEQDKVIDESEALRTKPIEQSLSAETQGASTSDNKSDAPSKEELDKIIDESEPVRDEIKNTKSEADPSATQSSSSIRLPVPPEQPQNVLPLVSAQTPLDTSPGSSPRKWHAKRRGVQQLI